MEHLHLRFHTWVLVADGAKALFLLNEGDERYPRLRVIEVHTADSKRSSASGDGSASGGVATASQQQMAEDRFAKDTAEALNQAALENRFERLVVVAPAKALAELRANFHKEVQQRIVAEIDKDLTKHPVPEIERVLTGTSEK